MTPIFKNGNKDYISDHRPIGVINPFVEIFLNSLEIGNKCIVTFLDRSDLIRFIITAYWNPIGCSKIFSKIWNSCLGELYDSSLGSVKKNYILKIILHTNHPTL